METKTGLNRLTRPRRMAQNAAVVFGPALLCFLLWRSVFWMDVNREWTALHNAGFPMNLGALDRWYAGDQAARKNATDMLAGLNSLKSPVNAWTNLPFVNQSKNPKSQLPLEKELLTGARDYLRVNQAALETARSALGRGHYRFPVDFSEGYLMLLPHLPKVRLAASLCALEAACLAEEGELTKAWHAIQDIGEFSRCLADEPLGISYLIRIRLKTMQLDTLEWLISTHRVDEAGLTALQACLEEEDFVPQYRLLLGTEAASGLSLLESSPGQFSEELDRLAGNEIPAESVPRSWAGGWFFELSGFRDRDEWYLLKTFREWWLAAGTPVLARAQAGLAVKEHLDANAKELKLIVSGMMLRGIAQFSSRELALVTRSRLARVAVAVELYRLRHGDKPPAELADLASKELLSVPLNPVTGERILYQPSPNGYRLETRNLPSELAFIKPGQSHSSILRFEARH